MNIPGIALALSAALAGAPLEAMALGRLADVQIIDRDTGQTLETHYCRGEYWVAGQPGARYAIAIRNARGERLLAVTAVDGVNVISGETASWSQTGYVFGPGQGYEIDGWRKSNQEIAAFEFSAAPQSYAARTGRPANIGVIGVALFLERPHPIAYRELSSVEPPAVPVPMPAPMAAERSAAGGVLEGAAADSAARSRVAAPAAAPYAAQAAPPEAKLGTGHGAREYSYVEDTEFERLGERPNEVIRIRYDSLRNLVAAGIIRPRPPLPPQPNPFPDSPGARFTPDPPPG